MAARVVGRDGAYTTPAFRPRSGTGGAGTRELQIRSSITLVLIEPVRDAILAMPENAWVPAKALPSAS